MTATTYIMPPKKAMTTSSVPRTLDTNQRDEALLREARNQKRKVVSLEPQDGELDQEINNLEAIHQQMEKCREKVLRLSKLQQRLMKQLKRYVTLKRKISTITRTRTMRAATMTIFVMSHSTSMIFSMTKRRN
jgi:predicted RNase H-like nuclease (RuvC/YqgF family)